MNKLSFPWQLLHKQTLFTHLLGGHTLQSRGHTLHARGHTLHACGHTSHSCGHTFHVACLKQAWNMLSPMHPQRSSKYWKCPMCKTKHDKKTKEKVDRARD